MLSQLTFQLDFFWETKESYFENKDLKIGKKYGDC